MNGKNPAERFGWTPLHKAVQSGHLNIFRLIIENIDNRNPATFSGLTLWDIAKTRNQKELIQLFAGTAQVVENHGCTIV